MAEFKFGIIGTGGIAEHFSDSVKQVKGATAFAVFSRTIDRGEAFAKRNNIDKAFCNLKDFLSCGLDCVYIATPHNFHFPYAKECINAGVPVLIEKPMCISEAQAKELFDLAEKKRVFCMEAMWSSFLPSLQAVKDILNSGELGKIKKVYGDFTFWTDKPVTHRLKNPELAGGALYDLGVYSIHFIINLLGINVKSVYGTSVRGETDVDYSTTVVLNYGDAIGVADCGINAMGHNLGIVCCEHGKIIFPKFERKNVFTVVTEKDERTVTVPQSEFGFIYQIMHVMDRIGKGEYKSDVETPEKTLAAHRFTDLVLEQNGFKNK